MLAHLKWATQRVTMILVVLLVLVIPFVLAKLGQLLGLWVTIDNLYPEQLGTFILLLVLSRAIYALAWAGIGYFLVDRGQKSG